MPLCMLSACSLFCMVRAKTNVNYHRLKPMVCSHGPVWLKGSR